MYCLLVCACMHLSARKFYMLGPWSDSQMPCLSFAGRQPCVLGGSHSISSGSPLRIVPCVSRSPSVAACGCAVQCCWSHCVGCLSCLGCLCLRHRKWRWVWLLGSQVWVVAEGDQGIQIYSLWYTGICLCVCVCVCVCVYAAAFFGCSVFNVL